MKSLEGLEVIEKKDEESEQIQDNTTKANRSPHKKVQIKTSEAREILRSIMKKPSVIAGNTGHCSNSQIYSMIAKRMIQLENKFEEISESYTKIHKIINEMQAKVRKLSIKNENLEDDQKTMEKKLLDIISKASTYTSMEEVMDDIKLTIQSKKKTTFKRKFGINLIPANSKSGKEEQSYNSKSIITDSFRKKEEKSQSRSADDSKKKTKGNPSQKIKVTSPSKQKLLMTQSFDFGASNSKHDEDLINISLSGDSRSEDNNDSLFVDFNPRLMKQKKKLKVIKIGKYERTSNEGNLLEVAKEAFLSPINMETEKRQEATLSHAVHDGLKVPIQKIEGEDNKIYLKEKKRTKPEDNSKPKPKIRVIGSPKETSLKDKKRAFDFKVTEPELKSEMKGEQVRSQASIEYSELICKPYRKRTVRKIKKMTIPNQPNEDEKEDTNLKDNTMKGESGPRRLKPEEKQKSRWVPSVNRRSETEDTKGKKGIGVKTREKEKRNENNRSDKLEVIDFPIQPNSIEKYDKKRPEFSDDEKQNIIDQEKKNSSNLLLSPFSSKAGPIKKI